MSPPGATLGIEGDEFRGNALEMSFDDENCGKLIIIFAH
jgi:hypothetical protein